MKKTEILIDSIDKNFSSVLRTKDYVVIDVDYRRLVMF